MKPITFNKAIVYSSHGEPSLTLDNTCGELIDKLMSICLGDPEFLPRQTCHRYLQLLPIFKNFVFSVPFSNGQDILVANELIAAICPFMLDEWVCSFMSEEHHPILPSYALDLTQFIARMVRGAHRYEQGGPAFEVASIVKAPELRREISLGMDKGFKSDFTRNNPLRWVVCRVPTDGAVKRGKEVIFRPGEEFLFLTGRCYLSMGFNDHVHVSCDEKYQPNLQADFEFFGEIGAMGEVMPVSLRGSQSKVPANWVVAAVSEQNIEGQWVARRLPVPYSE